MYVSDLKSSVKQPIRQLKAFRRIHLAKGSSKKVAFKLAVQDLSFWDAAKKSFVVEPGEFEIQVGASSADIRARSRLTVRA